MSRTVANVGFTAASFPRVSGDEPGNAVKQLSATPFSPRERG